MPQDDEWVEEQLSDEVLLELRRIADKSSSRSPDFDNMHEHQRREETAIFLQLDEEAWR